MNQDLWEKVASVCAILQPLREADSPVAVKMIDLVDMRGRLRTQLEELRIAIIDHFSERDAYFVLFPLMAHCDEVVQMRILDAGVLEWPPLQQELYQVADAGDLFFELLENALNKPETLPLVYEMYYFCLNDGFCGRYSGNPNRIADYLQLLLKKIHLQPLVPIDSQISQTGKGAFFRIPNHLYYIAAGSLLILFYWFLSNLASSWQPS